MDGFDDFDLAIMSILQEDATRSYAAIGAQINLSSSATLRRVKRLRNNGSIVATRAVINAQRVGIPLKIIVEISMENEHVTSLNTVRESLISDQSVQYCYYVTGDVDFILVGSFSSMNSYKLFTERHFIGKIWIKKFKTYVVMDEVKETTALPLKVG